MADERCGVVGHVVAGEVGLILGEPGEEQGDVAFVDADIVPSFLRFPCQSPETVETPVSVIL